MSEYEYQRSGSDEGDNNQYQRGPLRRTGWLHRRTHVAIMLSS